MSAIAERIEENVDLAPHNTLQVHANARYFMRINSAGILQQFLRDPEWSSKPSYVLGGGSNVLFLDNFDGVILHMGITGRKVVKSDGNHVWLKIGAGENWHETVRYCVGQGWGGIENLSLIPGRVGAAPIQNIGAYGAELEQVFDCLTAVERATGERRTFTREECAFGYRDSIFKQELSGKYVITDVTLKLARDPVLNTNYGAIRQKLNEKDITDPTIKDISDTVIEIRNAKLPDPAELGNAGSFFKNPIVGNNVYERLKADHPDIPGYEVDDSHTKVPAGWLIEQAGWKGREVGGTGTYRQQALVIVNHGGATGPEILQLSNSIQQSVREQFDIELVPEVNIVE